MAQQVGTTTDNSYVYEKLHKLPEHIRKGLLDFFADSDILRRLDEATSEGSVRLSKNGWQITFDNPNQIHTAIDLLKDEFSK